MKHRLPLYVVLVTTLLCGPARGSGIESEVNAVAADRVLHRATLAVQVVALGNGPGEMREVFGRNAHYPLVPASNLKLVTTAAALDKLGADFKFRTTLNLVGQDLVLVGDGDPSFGDAVYLKRVGWKPTSVYEGWARQLQQRGVTSVRDVVVDDGAFDETFVHPDWPADQLDEYYEAGVGGVNFNVNVLDVVVGPGGQSVGTSPATGYAQLRPAFAPGSKKVFEIARDPGTNVFHLRGDPPARGAKVARTVHDPALYAATVLSETLAAAGVKVTGTVRKDRTFRGRRPGGTAAAATGPAPVVIGVHETPIAAVLARANKDSVNVYADSLCKRIGYDPARPAVPGSWETGVAAATAYLKRAGIPETDFRLHDGCGLSKRNAISPRALVRVLCYEFYGKNREAYARSLAVAGVDGSFENRFKGSDLRQRVFGKSGFVEGVSTLGGYLRAKDDQWYAFSIMVNGIPRLSNGQVKLLQERIVRAVDAEVGGKK